MPPPKSIGGVLPTLYLQATRTTQIENMRRTLLDPLGMHELEQHDFTYQHTDCRARLDRVYTNLHASASITKEVVCKTLRWHEHSDHRPIHFHIRSKRTDHSNLLQEWAVRRPEWPDLVKEHMHGSELLTNPFDNISQLKYAFRTACNIIVKSADARAFTSLEDQLTATIGCLAAAEAGDWRKAARWTSRYPLLTSLFTPPIQPNPYIPVPPDTSLSALRDHAVRLSRDVNHKQLQELSEGQLPETVKAPRRKALLNKFQI